jgi:hypothetical protein
LRLLAIFGRLRKTSKSRLLTRAVPNCVCVSIVTYGTATVRERLLGHSIRSLLGKCEGVSRNAGIAGSARLEVNGIQPAAKNESTMTL